MSALITDLLDMARIETGALPVSAEPADPAILVDQARNTFLSGGPGNPVAAGADDYIVKPFSPTELVARIQTVLRRRAVPATAEPAEPFVSGELTIDYGERRVSLSGRSIPLINKEYRLLCELSVNAGRVVVPMITCCRRCGAPDTPGIRGRCGPW